MIHPDNDHQEALMTTATVIETWYAGRRSPLVQQAYAAARPARFEHGGRGA